jgi:hypothetical protein
VSTHRGIRLEAQARRRERLRSAGGCGLDPRGLTRAGPPGTPHAPGVPGSRPSAGGCRSWPSTPPGSPTCQQRPGRLDPLKLTRPRRRTALEEGCRITIRAQAIATRCAPELERWYPIASTRRVGDAAPRDLARAGGSTHPGPGSLLSPPGLAEPGGSRRLRPVRGRLGAPAATAPTMDPVAEGSLLPSRLALSVGHGRCVQRSGDFGSRIRLRRAGPLGRDPRGRLAITMPIRGVIASGWWPTRPMLGRRFGRRQRHPVGGSSMGSAGIEGSLTRMGPSGPPWRSPRPPARPGCARHPRRSHYRGAAGTRLLHAADPAAGPTVLRSGRTQLDTVPNGFGQRQRHPVSWSLHGLDRDRRCG